MGGVTQPTGSTPVAQDDWAKDLTYQQELYVLEYMANGGKGGKAALAAGYSHPDVNSTRILKNVQVAAAIRWHMNQLHKSYHLEADAILRELAAVAGFNLGDILTRDAHGNPQIDLSMATSEQTKALASVETERTSTGRGKEAAGHLTKVKVRTHDKLAALRLLMDQLGMLKTTAAVQVNLDFGERMAAANVRALGARDD